MEFLEFIKRVVLFRPLREFHSDLIKPGSDASTKRWVFLGGFYILSYAIFRLTNAIAHAIYYSRSVDTNMTLIWGALMTAYTTTILVGYRKPDHRDNRRSTDPHSRRKDDKEQPEA